MKHDQKSSYDQRNHLSPSKQGLAGRLCIKLKISNNNNVDMIRKERVELERQFDNSGYRVCDICGKEFSSGKAWGGHKRHHLKTMKERVLERKGPTQSIKKVGVTERCYTIKAGDVKIKEGKPVCCLCGKSFSSMNGLFGHMKFHSDRDWKGTHPPSLTNNDSTTSPLNIHESDTVTCVDLSSSLTGWRKTDKRGKESSCNTVYQAAMDLMKLSQDKRVMVHPLHFPRKFKNLEKIELDEDDKGFLRDQLAKKLKRKSKISAKKKKSIAKLCEDGSDDQLIRPGGFKCSACGSSFSTFQALGGHRFSCTGKKSEESSQESEENQEENQQVPSGGGNCFQCDVCNKWFSNGQALGGHKRIHWKQTPVKTQVGPIRRECQYDEGCSRKLGFDLNEPYVLQDDHDE